SLAQPNTTAMVAPLGAGLRSVSPPTGLMRGFRGRRERFDFDRDARGLQRSRTMTAFLLALFALSTPPPADEAPRFAGRDPFALLGSHRVELGEDGAPLVTVGIAKGEEEVAIHFPEGAILHLPDGGRLEAPPRATWRFA